MGMGGRTRSGVSVAEAEDVNEGALLLERVVGLVGLQNSPSGGNLPLADPPRP